MPILTTPSPKVPLHQFGAMQIEEAAGSSEAPAQAEQPTTGREAKWDEEDEVWRCLDCFWEVTQGECAHCAATYERSEETVAREDEVRFRSNAAGDLLTFARSSYLTRSFRRVARLPLGCPKRLSRRRRSRSPRKNSSSAFSRAARRLR